MSQLPEGTLGDAIGVLIYTFICLFSNILLIWLHWTNREWLSYVALIAYFAMLCSLSSIIQQIYNYTLWNDLMWAQLYYIKANYENADVAFQNGNFGFMRVLANIRLFCYIMESSYFLSYAIHVTYSVYGFWSTRRRTERAFALFSKVVPLLLAGLTLGLLQTKPVQSSFLVYMIVANVQSVTACTLSIILIFMILWKYINVKRSWKRVYATRQFRGWRFPFGSRDNSRPEANDYRENDVSPQGFDNTWLVVRLSIAIVLISAFILASLITHLPQRDDIARDAKADAPDLSAERARSNIIGYIFGVTPGLAIWIVFGLTKTFRQIMYEKFVPYKWRRRKGSGEELLRQSPWSPTTGTPNTSTTSRPSLPRIETGVAFPMDDMDQGVNGLTSPNLTTTPLLVYNPTTSPTRNDKPRGNGRDALRAS
ncbi:hypothetical protein F5Y04DRAFT_16833 [Hypomontagnella monticulosa]|nr:hypothetical protein F5Y04DRAFT_16833 [Hypomontagnella monticulosa]